MSEEEIRSQRRFEGESFPSFKRLSRTKSQIIYRIIVQLQNLIDLQEKELKQKERADER